VQLGGHLGPEALWILVGALAGGIQVLEGGLAHQAGRRQNLFPVLKEMVNAFLVNHGGTSVVGLLGEHLVDKHPNVDKGEERYNSCEP
jgi:hypothetical protein